MGKLAAMDRLANKEAKKLGIKMRLNVLRHTQCPTKHQWYYYRVAHAHCYPDTKEYGTICIRWGYKDWRNAIKHEVAHFVPNGHDHNGVDFLRARAQQDSTMAFLELVRRGSLIC